MHPQIFASHAMFFFSTVKKKRWTTTYVKNEFVYLEMSLGAVIGNNNINYL